MEKMSVAEARDKLYPIVKDRRTVTAEHLSGATSVILPAEDYDQMRTQIAELKQQLSNDR